MLPIMIGGPTSVKEVADFSQECAKGVAVFA
jgi:hypothetical protein